MHLSQARLLRNIHSKKNPGTLGVGMKAFLTGIGLGAAIGVAIAPPSGSNTRKKVKTWSADLGKRMDQKFSPGGNGEDPQNGAEPRAASDRVEANRNQDAGESTSAQDEVAEVLNNASKTKLRSVPGIGDATARRIIESRPFESEAEVLENKVLPEKVLKTLKDKLVDGDEEVA
jgi:DNA uptake protein ComE-like DNA-binding protein